MPRTPNEAELQAILRVRRKENAARRCPSLPVKPLITEDGTRISVQASCAHYCQPKQDMREHYGLFEVGMETDAKTITGVEIEDLPDGVVRVYGWVTPAQIIAEIDARGGLRDSQLTDLESEHA